ncbi:MAG TPA: hypothetical protein VNB22_02725 [Pyrinomonadaceae bacterium]|jgi:hypothetical protein|nr:hypothetical protein [Pyrinomonadaceae bacterium]
MKTFILTSVLVFTLCFISCSVPENVEVKQPNSVPILEMSWESIGNWDVTGEILDFRLYDNGLVEFDILDNNKKDRTKTIYSTEELRVRKQFYISDSEVKRILKLLTSNEFADLKKTYQAKRAGTDIAHNNKILFQDGTREKTIEILGHIEDLSKPDPENFPDFPPILSYLYEQTHKIKNQASKK